MALKGKGTRAIAKELPFSRGIVKRVIKENNIDISNNSSRKYHFNQKTFECIDNEEKAYWLGFLYADGCVSFRTVKMRLSAKDATHAQKFLDFMQSDSKLEYGIQDSFGSKSEYVDAKIYSMKLVDDLIKLGCVERKTLSLTMPNETQVPSELKKHFIRGYFDGDGSIVSLKNNKYSMSFVGTYSMLESLSEFFNVPCKIRKRHKHHEVGYISFGGNLQVLEKLEMIYSDATVFLDRKYELYQKIKEQYPSEVIEQRKFCSSRFRQ